MKTKSKWLCGMVAGVVIMVAFWLSKPSPAKPVFPEQALRHKIVEELVYASPWLGYLTPNNSGNMLANVAGLESGRQIELLDLESGVKRQLTKTNEVKINFGWSSDDRFLAFSQFNARTENRELGESQLVECWLALYDRIEDSIQRMTSESNVVDVKFFWLTNGYYMYASRRVTNGTPQFGPWMLGDVHQIQRQVVSDFIPELTKMTDQMGVFGKTDLSTLELKPIPKDTADTDSMSRPIQKISDFKTNDFTDLKWVNYCAAKGSFLFCTRPKSSDRRYLYEYNPARQTLDQLTEEDTYNGQWILNGDGYAYINNTNDSFQLAVREFSGARSTNLFTQGHVVTYKTSSRGNKIYAAASHGSEPHGIWEYNVTNQVLNRFVEYPETPFVFSGIAQPERFMLRSFDGVPIPCFLFAPILNFHSKTPKQNVIRPVRPRVKHPAVIFVPPPTAQFQIEYERRAQVFANLGFYFAAINYRGCDGYGAEYSKLANGKNAAQDVLKLYEKLATDTNIDKNNIFLTTSSGGMEVVTELLATKPGLWAGIALDKPGATPAGEHFDPNKMPPLLMVIGGRDPGLDSMNAFVGWANANKIQIETLTHAEAEHITYSVREWKETLQKMSDFFIEHMR